MAARVNGVDDLATFDYLVRTVSTVVSEVIRRVTCDGVPHRKADLKNKLCGDTSLTAMEEHIIILLSWRYHTFIGERGSPKRRNFSKIKANN